MTIFLSLALGLSALCLGLAHAMEAGAIRTHVSGANGFVLTMVMLASGTASLVVALIAWIVGGLWIAVAVVAGSIAWHGGVFTLSVWRLTRLARTSR